MRTFSFFSLPRSTHCFLFLFFSHLDAVRIVKLGVGEDENDLLLASGSDDMTVKLWRIDRSKLSSCVLFPCLPSGLADLRFLGDFSDLEHLQL